MATAEDMVVEWCSLKKVTIEFTQKTNFLNIGFFKAKRRRAISLYWAEVVEVVMVAVITIHR